jgi:tryptophan synthase beta chain
MELLWRKGSSCHERNLTLKDAVNEAMRAWTARYMIRILVFGSVMGPPRFRCWSGIFQSVFGREAKEQINKLEGRLPHAVVACVGGGSNAMGPVFNDFIEDAGVS